MNYETITIIMKDGKYAEWEKTNGMTTHTMESFSL